MNPDAETRTAKSSDPLRLVVACVAITLALSACGDDSPSSTGSPTTDPITTVQDDVCADRDALSSSIEALKGVDLRAEGTDAVDAAVEEVQDDLDALEESANSAVQPEIDAVQDAAQELGPAVDNIGEGGAGEAATAVADVATAAATLMSSLEDAQCG